MLIRLFRPLLDLFIRFLPVMLLPVAPSFSTELMEPLTLSSENGVLDLLMVAKAAAIQTLPKAPTGWVYEICKRPANGANACPAVNSGIPNYYGGTLLRLQPGDHLKVHLVNQLPMALDSKHAIEPGREFLTLNPTNIHTHGLLVAPNGPSATNPTYGDNVFVLTFNSANGKPIESPHMHSAIRYDFTDYDIHIPNAHPSGLFWFHPHSHGVALNQISAGLSGLISVGSVGDYVCKAQSCASFASHIGVRHIMLKDTQILPSGKLQDQEDPALCAPTLQTGEGPRQGSCAGQDESASGGPNYTNGKWFFTLNGQQYPTMPVQSSGGEIWRIANTSGSVTYDLNLWNSSQNRNMLVQVLSVDGVSVSPTNGISKQTVAEINGTKFVPEVCPGVEPAGSDDAFDEPVCTRTLHMMPSSRMEVWVSYRTSKDELTSPPQGSFAVFRTRGYQTGPSGDSWPAVDLARVEFQAPADAAMPQALRLKGEALSMLAPLALSSSMSAENAAVAPDTSCKSLPPGHIRRIFYSVPTSNLSAFGLAAEELDEHGNVVGTPVTDVTPFKPHATDHLRPSWPKQHAGN